MRTSLFKYPFLVLAFALVATSSGLLMPQKAHAIPVEDGVMEAEGAAIAAINERTAETTLADFVEKVAEWGMTVARWVKDDLMKTLRDVVAKRIMDYIVNQTVRWIQGGGSPKFVSSWSGFAKDVGNIAFDTVVQQVGAASICSPFSLQVKLSLLPVQTFPVQISCTLDQVVSNIKNFYVNFNQGGWPAYASMWSPENNYYGQMLMIQDNLQLESAKKLTAAINEAISGSGFLSVKKCVEWNAEGLQMCVDSGQSFDECQKAACTKEEIQTPGAAVGEAVKNSITSDTQWGANIQSWVSALVNALINRVMSEGFMAMKNAVSGGSSSGSSGNPTNSYQNLIDNELTNQKNQLNLGLSSALKEEQYLLNAKNKTLSVFRAEQAYLSQIPTSSPCSVSQSQINGVANNVANLNSQIATLQFAVNEINDAMDAVNKVTSAVDLAAGMLTTNSVSDKYNTTDFQRQIATGSARTAADQETAAAQAGSDAAKNSFVSCSSTSIQTQSGNISDR